MTKLNEAIIEDYRTAIADLDNEITERLEELSAEVNHALKHTDHFTVNCVLDRAHNLKQSRQRMAKRQQELALIMSTIENENAGKEYPAKGGS